MRPWLHLARISNLPTVWTNVTAAWLLAGGALNDPRLAWLILAGSLLYTGGMILNDAADVKFDREHRKERPIPSGKVSVMAAWSTGLGMLVIGAGLAIGFGASVWITLALVAAILFYDLYHKPWAGSVIVMGACRTLLYFMAGSVIPDWPLWRDSQFTFGYQAVGLGLYIVGLSQIARADRWRGVGILIFVPLLVGNMFGPVSHATRSFWNHMDLIVSMLFLGVLIWTKALINRKRFGEGVGTLLAAIPIVDAFAIVHVSPKLALAFVALVPILRLWQRWVAAT